VLQPSATWHFFVLFAGAAREEFVALMRDRARFFQGLDDVQVDLSPSCRDPKDNKFLSLAFAAEADAVVSSDKDLQVMHRGAGSGS
jgi:putative PIN family toxin of toxin-antitoxin system